MILYKNVDDRDRTIIELLQKNARMPFTEIAKVLGVTETTVRKRIADLEKKGIIKRYTIEVDPEKMGYNSVTILGLDVEPKYLLEAAKKLVEVEETRWVATSTGDHMIMTEIWAKNGEHLFKILTNKVGKIKGVKDLCPAIIMERIK